MVGFMMLFFKNNILNLKNTNKNLNLGYEEINNDI